MPGNTAHNANNVEELLGSVALGLENPSCTGKDVVVINLLWDKRTVVANYVSNPSKVDATSPLGFFLELEVLRGLIEELLTKGKKFVTKTGGDDLVCTLEWSVR